MLQSRYKRKSHLLTVGHHHITFEAVAAFLAATPTRLVSVAVEDVLGLDDQVNVPGTVGEHPNWRRRWPLLLEELASDQRLTRIADAVERLISSDPVRKEFLANARWANTLYQAVKPDRLAQAPHTAADRLDGVSTKPTNERTTTSRR